VNVDALVDAAERAIALRGTVMLAVRGDEDRWCAVCAAVDGSVELRVAEPDRGWRSRRAAPGEAWLREHGFVPVIDAWAAPGTDGASPYVYAETLSAALREGLGAPEDGELIEVLVHPGLVGDTPAPPASAPHGEHIRYALTALAERRRSKVCIQGGRPAATWAWLFAADGELTLSPEPADGSTDYREEWAVDLETADLGAEADELTKQLHEGRGRNPGDPLFVSFIDS
jgi:hypothetical protein